MGVGKTPSTAGLDLGLTYTKLKISIPYGPGEVRIRESPVPPLTGNLEGTSNAGGTCIFHSGNDAVVQQPAADGLGSRSATADPRGGAARANGRGLKGRMRLSDPCSVPEWLEVLCGVKSLNCFVHSGGEKRTIVQVWGWSRPGPCIAFARESSKMGQPPASRLRAA